MLAGPGVDVALRREHHRKVVRDCGGDAGEGALVFLSVRKWVIGAPVGTLRYRLCLLVLVSRLAAKRRWKCGGPG